MDPFFSSTTKTVPAPTLPQADPIVLLAKQLADDILVAALAKIDCMIAFDCNFLREAQKEIVGPQAGTEDYKQQFINQFIPDHNLYGALDHNEQLPTHHDLSNLLKNTIGGLMNIVVQPLAMYSALFQTRCDDRQNLAAIPATKPASDDSYGSLADLKEDDAQSALTASDRRLKYAALDIARLVATVMPMAGILPDHRDYYKRAKTIIALLGSQEYLFMNRNPLAAISP